MSLTPSVQNAPTATAPAFAAAFTGIISRDGWSIPEVGGCLKHFAAETQAGDDAVCRTLLAWLDATPQVGAHLTGRRFTRLQFMENSLSSAGFQLTLRDFSEWLTLQAGGDWQPNALLPYAPQDLRLLETEARVEQLEHELHHMEVKANRARAEVTFVVAERDQFIASNTAEIHRLITQDYESSASWRVTQPLRRAMNGMREAKAWLRSRLSRAPQAQVGDALAASQSASSSTSSEPAAPATVAPKWVTTAAPWNKPGYSTEAAWRGTGQKDEFDYSNYKEWVQRYDTLSAQGRAEQAQQAEALTHKPLISVLMNAKHPVLGDLQQAVASVLAQIYPYWELCIAVAADCSPAIKPVLQAYAEQDARIKLLWMPETQADVPVAPKQAALDLATGEWIVILSAIDLIAEKALFMLATDINKHKNIRLIYSDEDKIIGGGGGGGGGGYERCLPYFKPDWNPDLFYAQDFTEHLCAYQTELVRQVGGFDAQFNDAASFDLTLRCLEQLDVRQIHHIPAVLYHKRVVDAVDALFLEERSRNLVQGERALNAHFARRGQAAKAQAAELGYRIHYALPAVLPLVSLIIPTKNNTRLLRQCITSILEKTSYPHYEILVVDNGSDLPDALDYLKSLASKPKVRVIRDNYAFNYSALNNAAVKMAIGEVVGLVNDDIEVKTADWLTEMVSHALRPGVGAVGARLWYPDYTLQHAGVVLVGGVARHVHKHLPEGAPGYCGRAVLAQEYSAVTGACLVVKKALYLHLGGLNEVELAIGLNDVDFCLRLIEAGYHNVWTPYAELIHHESATRGQDDSPQKQRRAEKELRYMRKRWGDRLNIDPAYNPNLTDGHDNFSLAWPPRVAESKTPAVQGLLSSQMVVQDPVTYLASVFGDYMPLLSLV
jgi:GT2 family glycosyltransferase